MEPATLLGLLGGTLTTASFVPQVWKTWKSKSTKDISLVMFILISTGIALWIAYGLMISSLPVIISNCITLVLTMIIVALKLIYK